MIVHATPGRHLLADLRGIAAPLLMDAEALQDALIQAARQAGAHVLGAHFHHFGEQAGVTGVVMLSESHISIHTWPEHGFAALDVFMCGHAQPELALQHIRDVLRPGSEHVTCVERG
ncbi:adenosylmethionine decarboxylase [Bordetella genomosp. 4]|uniref:S-adenosylmethionine decarboxylase proenzyme n=1 Tax=Bordetella genomosp. 4 TaxID=463044 RepID=A0A261U1Z8_9BORD|nr:adenosylmethionine decarboxylase [Bordetella genomosp. 4]OZI49545.1 adenosylmethionine decarboxylase [Bordetella genomosp. 4]OZI55986.1 adenosylmethionine decarboxylase [Bordetella genomosp. 4]